MKLSKKKGNMAAIAGVTGLVSLVIILVIYSIVTSFGAEITSDIRDDFVTNTAGCNATTTAGCGYEYNISSSALDGLSETADKMPTVSKITVAAIIISIILASFGGFIALRN